MMIGEDLYFHDKAENLAKLVALVEATCDIDVVMTPPKSNALGVALICDLDDEATGYTIGYNENGDFRLSALGDGDLDMPAMNQQEGTLTSMGKRVLPTNAALEYEGYELNDLMKALVGAPELTIDWTPMLPEAKGFKAVEFDALPNAFTNDGRDNRGYKLNVTTQEVALPTVEKFDENVFDCIVDDNGTRTYYTLGKIENEETLEFITEYQEGNRVFGSFSKGDDVTFITK